MSHKSFHGLKNALKSPQDVRELSLDGYREKNLAALDRFPYLESLRLFYYKNKELDLLPPLPHLQSLSFSWGEKTCPEILFSFPELKHLEITHSPIKELPASLAGLENLESLDLTFLNLKKLPENVLGLRKLKKIILDNNKLTSLPEEINALENLSEIYLTNNFLIELPENFALLPLRQILLNGNPLIEQANISSKVLSELFKQFQKRDLSVEIRKIYLQLLLGNLKKAEKIAGKKTVLHGLNAFLPEIRRNAARYFYHHFENPFSNPSADFSKFRLCLLGANKTLQPEMIQLLREKTNIRLDRQLKTSTTHVILDELPRKKINQVLHTDKILVAAGHLSDFVHTLQGYYLTKDDAETNQIAGKILSLLNSGEESNQKLALELALGGGIHPRFLYEIILLYIWKTNNVIHQLAAEVLEKHLTADTLMDFKLHFRVFDNYHREEDLADYLEKICGNRLDPNELGIRLYRQNPKARLFCMRYPRAFLQICKEEIKYNVLHLDHLHLKKIHTCIAELPQIKFLYANHNRLSELPPNLDELADLSYLYLHNNAFKTFPNIVLNLKNLKILSLHVNRIRQIPERIVELQQLEQLYLKSNKIENLPENLSRLKKLKVLVLEKNPIARNTTYIQALQEMLPNCQIRI